MAHREGIRGYWWQSLITSSFLCLLGTTAPTRVLSLRPLGRHGSYPQGAWPRSTWGVCDVGIGFCDVGIGFSDVGLLRDLWRIHPPKQDFVTSPQVQSWFCDECPLGKSVLWRIWLSISHKTFKCGFWLQPPPRHVVNTNPSKMPLWLRFVYLWRGNSSQPEASKYDLVCDKNQWNTSQKAVPAHVVLNTENSMTQHYMLILCGGNLLWGITMSILYKPTLLPQVLFVTKVPITSVFFGWRVFPHFLGCSQSPRHGTAQV